MKRMSRFTLWLAIVGGIALCAGRTKPTHAYTAKYFAWENPTSECPDASPVTGAGTALAAWHDKMLDKGWSSGGYLVDGNINLDRFCDSYSGLSGCSDSSNGVDEADAVIIGIHGLRNVDHWESYLRYDGTSGSCWGNEGGSFRVGDDDAEFVLLASCHSLDDDNTPLAYTLMYDPSTSGSSRRRLHILTGFHGLAAVSSRRKDEYKQVAKDGFKGVRDAWMDNLYDGSVRFSGPDFPDRYEMCPVVYAIGSSDSNCETRLLNDEYESPYSDPSSVSAYCYSYYEDCDPADEPPFSPVD